MKKAVWLCWSLQGRAQVCSGYRSVLGLFSLWAQQLSAHKGPFLPVNGAQFSACYVGDVVHPKQARTGTLCVAFGSLSHHTCLCSRQLRPCRSPHEICTGLQRPQLASLRLISGSQWGLQDIFKVREGTLLEGSA